MTTTTTIRGALAAVLLLGAAAARLRPGRHGQRSGGARQPARRHRAQQRRYRSRDRHHGGAVEPAGHHHARDAEQRRAAAVPDRCARRAPGQRGDAGQRRHRNDRSVRHGAGRRRGSGADQLSRQRVGGGGGRRRPPTRLTPGAATANSASNEKAEDASMPDDALIGIKPEIAAKASVNAERHRAMSEAAKRDPEGFWRGEMRRVAWMKEPTRIKSGTSTGTSRIRWFEGGELNASANCLDRHLEAGNGDQRGHHLGGRRPEQRHEGHLPRAAPARSASFANVLMRGMGVKKGDRVCIYLPMIVEAAVAMLACARIGAVHSVVFGGFSPDSAAPTASWTRVQAADHRRRGRPRRPKPCRSRPPRTRR